MDNALSLAQLVHQQAVLNPEHSALVVDEVTYSYGDIAQKAQILASWLQKKGVKRLGIYASRNIEVYISILAAHWIGSAYVPLNPTFPAARLNKIAERAQLDAIVVDPLRLEALNANPFLSSLPIAPHSQSGTSESPSAPIVPLPDHLAYLMFTSGSTGEPKGVPIAFSNLGHFIQNVHQRYALTPTDRVSQFCALSFDVSIFDMCLAWSAGATLHVIPEAALLNPAHFIRHHQLTVWLAVPAIINLMNKLNTLKPNQYPTLKHSLFTGEALTIQQAELWQQAAPNSQLENLYGPTETTIDCFVQPINEKTRQSCLRDIVPIGQPFPGIYAGIIDEQKKFLANEQQGELVIAGPQVASGYWHDAEKTQQKFVKLTHPEYGEKTWYLTGDCCYIDSSSIYHYLHRLDGQRKILGHRVELEEIEYFLRHITQCNEVAVLIHEIDGLGLELVAIIGNPNIDPAAIQQQLKMHLPNYMVPAHIFGMESLPHNSNGKMDRKKLTDYVAEKLSSHSNNRG
jgi:D-alanine--poly(phosphoribitol) ligase subunit 1